MKVYQEEIIADGGEAKLIKERVNREIWKAMGVGEGTQNLCISRPRTSIFRNYT